MPRVAAVTMAYNEAEFLPVWARHYGAEVGAEHCYVVDHGSDDGSTGREALGAVNVVRIPRSPHDDRRRAEFISKFSASLLLWYDCVLYTDSDEIVMADPAKYASLLDYCGRTDAPATNAIGFNVVQVEGEAALDGTQAAIPQRHWMHFSGAMCKPVLIRRPVTWVPGFHNADAPAHFDDLYLFHMRWADRAIALRRLARTRAQPWADAEAGWWQRVEDEAGAKMFDDKARGKRNNIVPLNLRTPALREALATVIGREVDAPGGAGPMNVNHEIQELWRIPDRFRGRKPEVFAVSSRFTLQAK